MKNQNKHLSNAGQSEGRGISNQKRELNLRKNSTLYFQIGLILCLLGVYGLFELNFKAKTYEIAVLQLEPDDSFEMKNYVPEESKVPEKKAVKKKRVVTVKPPEIVPNDTPDEIITSIIDTEPPSTNEPVSIESIENPDNIVEPIDMPLCISCVEIAPIYPGCENEKSNEERTKCMSQKLSKLVQRQFRTDAGNTSNLQGVQRIMVQFKIDKNGLVTDVKTRAPNKKLEEEAKRVINKIPEMIPGKQRQQPVSVLYNLPIVFKIQN